MTRFRIIHHNTGVEAPAGEFLIGRSSTCHLVLNDAAVSRVHAAIVNSGERLMVEDRGSRNGVKVNGIAVVNPIALQDGDEILIGHQTIRIACLDHSRDTDHTVGMTHCNACNGWLAPGEMRCGHCGAQREETGVFDSGVISEPITHSQRESSIIESQPLAMMAGVAQKAIRVKKLEEAQRLIGNALRHAVSRLESGQPLEGKELEAIADVVLELLETAKTPEMLSSLFVLYRKSGRLMQRELVERLYSAARTAGYHTCQEMTRYISTLGLKAEAMSPGERFIVRRLEGLAKVCA